MLNFLRETWGRMTAATQLSPVPVPKVPKAQQVLPSYLRSATPNPDSALPTTDRRLASTNIEDYRSGVDTRQVVRDFIAASPDLAASVNAYIRTAVTSSYTAVAREMDGTFSREGTNLLQQLITRFDVVGDYEDGFAGISSLRSNSESMAKEILSYGAMAAELVLGKDRLPRGITPVSVSQIFFYPDKSGAWLRPVQRLGGVEIDLDVPTFSYVALDQSLLDAYPTSPLEPAIQPVLFSAEFMNDLRRIVKRVVHPRLVVKINEATFRKNMPQSALASEEATASYMASMISDIETRVNGLKPEDALVYFDTLGVDLLNNGNISLSDEWEVLSKMIDAKMSTGAKSLPSILGHGSGSQNVASSETLLFMKNATGAVQEKLNEIYSRLLTLALRLYGLDVYCEFRYAEIDLRPASELEAFRVMKQSRVLEQLSYGFITDDDAALQLTGQLTPPGFKPLSGTLFYEPKAAAENPYSNTSGNDASQQSRQTRGAPQQPKGPAKK